MTGSSLLGPLGLPRPESPAPHDPTAAPTDLDPGHDVAGFATCNANCEEPVNFGWIQKHSVPTAPFTFQPEHNTAGKQAQRRSVGRARD